MAKQHGVAISRFEDEVDEMASMAIDAYEIASQPWIGKTPLERQYLRKVPLADYEAAAADVLAPRCGSPSASPLGPHYFFIWFGLEG